MVEGVRIDASTGNVINLYDGHQYNSHTLQYEKVDAINSSSDAVEISIACRRCGQHERATIHTESEPHIWTVYMYLVGQFNEQCEEPQQEIAKAATEVINSHRGEVATPDLFEDMKDEIRSKVGRPDLCITLQ